jgi:hypothetical protein
MYLCLLDTVVLKHQWKNLLICFFFKQNCSSLLQFGAGTMSPEIISSLITGGSDGGGGQTNDSIISSVDRMIPLISGGSTRDDLFW